MFTDGATGLSAKPLTVNGNWNRWTEGVSAQVARIRNWGYSAGRDCKVSVVIFEVQSTVTGESGVSGTLTQDQQTIVDEKIKTMKVSKRTSKLRTSTASKLRTGEARETDNCS